MWAALVPRGLPWAVSVAGGQMGLGVQREAEEASRRCSYSEDP